MKITPNSEMEITEQEAELYDRQIRLWGLDSQKRLRSARILICGLNGLGAEIAKNIILSGVKSVTLLDDKCVDISDSTSQFLAPVDAIGQNKAEASLLRAQALNPMVKLNAITDNIKTKDDSFFQNYDVVIVLEAPTRELIRINNACRLNDIKFFAGDVWGMFGYSFADLQEHSFAEDIVSHKTISKPGEKLKTELITQTVKKTVLFTPFQDLLDFDFKSPVFLKKLKRTGPALLVLRVLQTFRDRENRDPDYKKRDEDIQKIIAIRDEFGSAELIPDDFLVDIFAQISTSAAIVGGELAQEIIKAVSQKEAPHNNIFLFDPVTCCGFIETIGN